MRKQTSGLITWPILSLLCFCLSSFSYAQSPTPPAEDSALKASPSVTVPLQNWASYNEDRISLATDLSYVNIEVKAQYNRLPASSVGDANSKSDNTTATAGSLNSDLEAKPSPAGPLSLSVDEKNFNASIYAEKDYDRIEIQAP